MDGFLQAARTRSAITAQLATLMLPSPGQRKLYQSSTTPSFSVAFLKHLIVSRVLHRNDVVVSRIPPSHHWSYWRGSVAKSCESLSRPPVKGLRLHQ